VRPNSPALRANVTRASAPTGWHRAERAEQGRSSALLVRAWNEKKDVIDQIASQAVILHFPKGQGLPHEHGVLA
jgi:hypothetical protein